MTIKLSGDLMDNFTEIITTVAQWDNVEAEVIMHITNKLEAAIIVEIENQLVAAVEQSYAEHPVSITEERATRADQGNLWTPRDCLCKCCATWIGEKSLRLICSWPTANRRMRM